MKKIINIILNYIKIKIINTFQILKNPGLFLSNLILFVFGGISNIPFPMLSFVIKHIGPWAGVSIVLPMRQYQYKLKVTKFKSLLSYFFLLLIAVVIILGGIQESNNFFFGFVQNLLSDIILISLAIYILPKFLNKPKNYKITLERKEIYNRDATAGKTEILISIHNSGEEVYKREEIFLEIFVPLACLAKDDIIMFNGDMEVGEVIYLPMWRFYFLNAKPLFLDQKLSIVNLKINNDILSGSPLSPFKIYYIFRTINGNIPTLEKVTRDFQGGGIPFDEYPKWGELAFSEYYNPDHPS